METEIAAQIININKIKFLVLRLSLSKLPTLFIILSPSCCLHAHSPDLFPSLSPSLSLTLSVLLSSSVKG